MESYDLKLVKSFNVRLSFHSKMSGEDTMSPSPATLSKLGELPSNCVFLIHKYILFVFFPKDYKFCVS